MSSRARLFVSNWVLLMGTAVLLLSACSDESGGTAPTESVDVDMGVDADECESEECGQLECPECIEGAECVTSLDDAWCECPAGTSQTESGCEPDVDCQPQTCGGNGECSEGEDGPVCECDEGYAGSFCSDCDQGWFDDGAGGCTSDPCEALSCEAEERCVVEDGQGQCECRPGTHSEDGVCVPDLTCLETTCNQNGLCEEIEGGVACSCDEGWAGESCDSCDEEGGYHDDGAGGCTTDPCLPNPCTDSNRNVCNSEEESVVCECNAGFHLEEDACVEDEMCQPDSCSGNGMCTAPGGVVECACDEGWAGESCASCDAASGYHDDGAGGCTTDPCLPNPCQGAFKSVCVTNGQSYVCECDSGYHPDGQGGCTDDPCVPDVCAASNQACRIDGAGDAECYTPTCDDQNPCTQANVVDGQCVYTDRPAGDACSTSACLVGQTCDGSGTCGGGSALDCDDDNPCTDDQCDTNLGCVNTPDDTLVPDDGITCTVGTCSGGLASFTPDDSQCDNGLWCDGEEVCQPGSASADADGCVVTNVPSPGFDDSGPCADYVCDESSQGFLLQPASVGAACNDGIYCTTNDACTAAGECRGTLDSNCGTGTCSTTNSLSTIDVQNALLDMTVTYEGQDPNVALPVWDFYVHAIDRETDTWVRLARYSTSSSGDRMNYTEKLPPGVYDIVYSSAYSRTTDQFGATTSLDYRTYGRTILEKNVRFYAGQNSYAVDIPESNVSVNVTYDGQDPSVVQPIWDFYVHAVDRETDTWVRIARYNSSASGDRMDYTQKLMPGTYDIVYSSTYSRDTDQFGATVSADYRTYGRMLLEKDLVVGPGTVIDVDVPSNPVSVNVTYDGQDPNVVQPIWDFYVHAVDRETDTWVRIARYNSSASGDRMVYTQKLMPGTYDLVYSSSSSRDTDQYGLTVSADYRTYGRTLLERDVVVGPGTVIDVDVLSNPVSVNVTYDGQDPDVVQPIWDFYVHAVDRETDTWVRIARYNSSASGDRMVYTKKLMPGTYDLVYSSSSSRDTDQYGLTVSSDYRTYGRTVLDRDVVVGPGTVIDVDVPSNPVSVNVTYDGQDPTVVQPIWDFYVHAVDRETDTWVRIARYNSSASGDRMVYTQKLMPGTYDLVYSSSSARDTDQYGLTVSADYRTYGRALLDRDVVVGPGTVIDVDVPSNPVSMNVTYDGQDPSVMQPIWDFYVHAIERETDTWIRIARYNSSASGDRMVYTQKLMPGTYDLVYSSSSSRSTNQFGGTSSLDYRPYGRTLVDRCIAP